MLFFFSDMCLLLSSKTHLGSQDLRQGKLYFTNKNSQPHEFVPQCHMCIQLETFQAQQGSLYQLQAREGGEALHLLYTAKQRSPFSCRAPAAPHYHLHSRGARLPKTTPEVIRNCSNKCLKSILLFGRSSSDRFGMCLSTSQSIFTDGARRKTHTLHKPAENGTCECVEQTSQQKPLSEWYLISK